MPVTVSERYFSEGIFAGALPGELLARYTCCVCGNRSRTFASFKAHRAGPECFPAVAASHAPGHGVAWERGEMSGPDRAALDALVAQLPDPDLDGPLATLVDLHA